MRSTYSQKLYSRTAIIKVAYHFTDRAYVHLDCDDSNYIVDLVQKPDCAPVDLQEFDNTLLAQLAREEVYQRTKEIREIALARAMASSVVETREEIPSGREEDTRKPEPLPFEESTDRPEDILKDWFAS